MKSCINSHNSIASYRENGRTVMISKCFKRYCGSVGIDVNKFVKLSLTGVRCAVLDHFFSSVNYSWAFFDSIRDALVSDMRRSDIVGPCRWSIRLNQSNVSWFRVESHNHESVADWFISDKCSSDFPMNPDCNSWHTMSRSTCVYYCVAIQCCEMPLSIPSHLWQSTYIDSQSHHLFIE